jgi:hypothetical protein
LVCVQTSVLGGTVVEGTDAVDAGTVEGVGLVVDDALFAAVADPHDAVSNSTPAESAIRPTPRCLGERNLMSRSLSSDEATRDRRQRRVRGFPLDA